MRLNLHSLVAFALLFVLSLAGCNKTSTAPALTPSASAATQSATAAAMNVAVPKKPFTSIAAEPTCPTNTTPVSDPSLGPGRICHGALPAYFAQVITQLPQSGSSPGDEKAWPTELTYTVIPGLGQRMDLNVGNIRSFEGSDPAITVYLVSGCGYNPGCKYGMKAYQVVRDATPVDATPYLLPDAPELSTAQREHYDEAGGGDLWLDRSKLSLAPNMRWIMEFDPDRPIPPGDPHDAGGVGHFGFLIWNGQRFELKDRVPRSQWPCFPVSKKSRACASDYPENDRFVIEGK